MGKTDGYHAENERTIIIGGASEFKNHAYDSMLHAREAVFSILKPESFSRNYILLLLKYTLMQVLKIFFLVGLAMGVVVQHMSSLH